MSQGHVCRNSVRKFAAVVIQNQQVSFVEEMLQCGILVLFGAVQKNRNGSNLSVLQHMSRTLLSWKWTIILTALEHTLVCFPSAIIHYKRNGVIQGGTSWKEVIGEEKKGAGRGRNRDVNVTSWDVCLTPLHLISIMYALEVAWRTVQVVPGVTTIFIRNQLDLAQHTWLDCFKAVHPALKLWHLG